MRSLFSSKRRSSPGAQATFVCVLRVLDTVGVDLPPLPRRTKACDSRSNTFLLFVPAFVFFLPRISCGTNVTAHAGCRRVDWWRLVCRLLQRSGVPGRRYCNGKLRQEGRCFLSQRVSAQLTVLLIEHHIRVSVTSLVFRNVRATAVLQYYTLA